MLLEILIAASFAIIFALSVPAYRRALRQDEPMRLWRHEWASSAEAASALGSAAGLACERRPESWSWLRSFLLAPIWLFWGPMTSMQPELRLARWWLAGTRTSGRAVRIEMPSQRAKLSITCKACVPLWASASRDGKGWPLEEQEGLRLLHPIDGVRWKEGSALIRAAFALGIDHLRVENSTLLADVALDERGPLPDEYPQLIEALESLATWIETAARA